MGNVHVGYRQTSQVMSNQHHEAFPHLRVRNASEAIEFYKLAFGAVAVFRISEPSGRVGHA